MGMDNRGGAFHTPASTALFTGDKLAFAGAAFHPQLSPSMVFVAAGNRSYTEFARL
jgi:hypothetical protein